MEILVAVQLRLAGAPSYTDTLHRTACSESWPPSQEREGEGETEREREKDRRTEHRRGQGQDWQHHVASVGVRAFGAAVANPHPG